MKKSIIISLLILGVFTCQSQAGEHRLGGGVNYWVALEDIDFEEVDDNGFSYLLSYQYLPGMFTFQFDFELLPDRFGETAYSPQAFMLLGRSIYGGVGIGAEYRDGDFGDGPFFALRGGLNLELLPGIFWDIYTTYRFNDSAELDNAETDIDTDTLFLGTVVRIAL